MNFSGGKWKEKSVVTALWDKQIKVFLVTAVEKLRIQQQT